MLRKLPLFALALLLGLAPVGAETATADRIPVNAFLYGGKLLTIDQDGAGNLTKGSDLYGLRLIVAAQGPYGVRLAFRGDLTSIGYIDPNALDADTLKNLRSAEGYTAVSWSRTLGGGFQLGPAAYGGAVVPVSSGVDWQLAASYGGGLRAGQGMSWLYVMAGRDKASDLACDCSLNRGIVVGSVELWRVAFQAEWVSGSGGRKRFGAMVRFPLPQWGAKP